MYFHSLIIKYDIYALRVFSAKTRLTVYRRREVRYNALPWPRPKTGYHIWPLFWGPRIATNESLPGKP